MAGKATYTVARSDDISPKCQCSCANTVTVYYSSGKEAAGQKTFSGKEEAVQVRVLEMS